MSPTQETALENLEDKIRQNEFFGYEDAANNHGVNLYPDLYFLARKLIIEHVGDRNLQNHMVSARPTNQSLIDTLYKIFKTKEDELTLKKAEKAFEDDDDDQ